MRRVPLIAASLIAAASLVRCSTFGAAEGLADAGGADATPDATDDVSDGAAAAADAGCSRVLFDDFERPALAGGPWDSDVVDSLNGGGLGIGSDHYRGRSSLLVTLPNPAGVRAVMTRSFVARNHTRISYAARRLANVARTILVNALDLKSSSVALYLTISDATIELREQDYTQTLGPMNIYPLGSLDSEWHFFAITLDLSTTPARVKVDIDGLPKHEGPLAYAFRPGDATASAGVNYADPGPPMNVSIDDISVCSEP